MVARMLAVACACLAIACGSGVTEVLIAVDSDLAAPAELDHVQIEVVGPNGMHQIAQGDLTEDRLPATVAIVHRGGPLADFTATATGTLAGTRVVERTAQFAPVPGEVRLLRLDLLRRCEGAACGAGQTCAESGCRSLRVTAEELSPYRGPIARIDAGLPPSDAGPPPDAGPPVCQGLPAMCGMGARGCMCDSCVCNAACGFDCEVECSDNPACNVTAMTGSNVTLACHGSTCALDVRGTSNASITCTDASVCDIDCRGGRNCRVDCSLGHCLLRCMGAMTCLFESCTGSTQECPMQVQACDRPCP